MGGSWFRGSARFEAVRELGAGGMGVVYEAIDRERAERVALEMLRDLDARGLVRFKKEFRALADLHHRNLVLHHGGARRLLLSDLRTGQRPEVARLVATALLNELTMPAAS